MVVGSSESLYILGFLCLRSVSGIIQFLSLPLTLPGQPREFCSRNEDFPIMFWNEDPGRTMKDKAEKGGSLSTTDWLRSQVATD